MTIEATRATGATPDIACEARAGSIVTTWRTEPLWCRQTRGLRYVQDVHGVGHAYCPAPGHRGNVERRWAVR